MSEMRARIESAMRQAYRAGWYDRAGGTGPGVDQRNEAEDRFMASFNADRILALLPTEGEPVAWAVMADGYVLAANRNVALLESDRARLVRAFPEKDFAPGLIPLYATPQESTEDVGEEEP